LATLLVLLLLFAAAPQAMDSSAEDLKTVTQVTGALQPITKEAPKLEKVAITADMKVGAMQGQARGGITSGLKPGVMLLCMYCA
jgi:hypothetical protein